jgi:hypothetical protein
MSQQTIIKKIPLPIIRVEQVTPDDEKEKKCGPHLSFENGSCIPLNLLIKMAKAYNQSNSNNNDNDNIKLDDTMDTLYPDEYKRFLLFEFQQRFKNSNQSKWIKKKFIELMSTEDKEYLENDVFRPEGPQGKFEWLSTLDINKTLAQYENKYPDFQFLGAVPIDFNDLDYYPFKTMDFSNFVKEGKNKIGIIFNLDEHYKGGSHWVSLYIDLTKGQVYFSDSYGTRPEKRIADFINRIQNYFEKSNIPNIDIRHNPTQHQKGNSECGVYSINFILRLLKGKTFDHITTKRLADEKVNKCRLRYFK